MPDNVQQNTDLTPEELAVIEQTKAMAPKEGAAYFVENDAEDVSPVQSPMSKRVDPVQSQSAPSRNKRTVKRRNAPEPVTVPLEFPIEIYEGDTLVKEITNVTLTRPFGRTIIAAQAEGSNVLATVCGLSAEEFDSLDGEDFYNISEKATPFLPKRLILQAQMEADKA